MNIGIKIFFLFNVCFSFLSAMKDFPVAGYFLQKEKDRKIQSLKFSCANRFLAISAVSSESYLEIFDFSKQQFVSAQQILSFAKEFYSNYFNNRFMFGKFLIKKTGSDIEIWDNSNIYKPYLFGKLHVFNISRCGKYFLTESNGRFIKVWRYSDLSLVDFAIDSSNCREAVFTSDSNFVLSINNDNVLKIWDFRDKKFLTLLGMQDDVSCLALSLCGKYLAIGYTDGKVATYNFADWLADRVVISAKAKL